MLDVFNCIVEKHNLWMVLLAAVICAFSVVTTLQAFGRGLKNTGRSRTIWLSAAGGVSGSGVWATHFVAMLAYSPSLPIQYGVSGTIVSLLIGMLGAAAGFHVAALGRGRPLIGGALVGLSVAAMHYVGIGAIESIFSIQWNWTFVVASVAISVAGSSTAIWMNQRRGPLQSWMGAEVLFLVAIVGLHFTGMTAVKLIPDLSARVSPQLLSRPTLAVLVGGMVFLILFAALVLIFIETQSRRVSMGALQVAFQGVPSGVALCDPYGKIVLWNGSFEALLRPLGVKIEKGMDRADLLHAASDGGEHCIDGLIEFEAALASVHAPWEGELPDGQWLRIENQILANKSVITVISDVTNLRSWADTMREARENAEAATQAKSDFLANMSHEIRTPLNGVLGMIQAMEQDELSPIQRQRVKIARDSGNALLHTLNDILDLAKVQAGRLELELASFDAGEVGESVCAAFAGVAANKGLTLGLEIEPAARGWWLGDALKLRQILSNLIANAIKFTLEGGVTLALAYEDKQLVFRVKDTGIGIDPGDALRLFEKFAQADNSTTRKFGGTGLGLAISRELVGLMNGRIWVESAIGKGASFNVAVALERGESSKTEDAVVPAYSLPLDTEAELKVLVAEDNHVNQLVLQSLLGPLNVSLTVTSNGEEAVEAFSKDQFDVVLMDIQMPQMNGIEATRMIRDMERQKGLARTPIIALTANVMRDQLDDYTLAGMDGHIAKPIEVERLYAALGAALDLGPAISLETPDVRLWHCQTKCTG